MNKALFPIFLVVAVDILAMTIILPLLPFYAEHLGATPTDVGLLVSIFAVCQLFGGPALGRMSDQMGRKPMLIVSQAGTLLGFIILAYAQTLWMVYLSRIIDGFTAGNISLAQAYIADVSKPEERTKSFAVIGIAFGLGFLVGPAISGFLAHFGYQYPIFAAMGLSLASIIATWTLLPGGKPAGAAATGEARLSLFSWGVYAGFFRRRELGPYLWQFFFFIFAFSTFMSGFPLFAERRFTWDGHPFTAREVGFSYAYVGVLGLILQGGLIGRLVKWAGDRGLVMHGFLFATIGFIALGWTMTVPVLAGVAAVIAFSTGVLRPALTSLITQTADRAEQGTVLGLTQSLQALAHITAPFLSGLLIEHKHLAGWAYMAAAACFAGLLVKWKTPAADSYLDAANRNRTV